MRLTSLFDEVRYGRADPSEEREERAVATLRNIEKTYGESDDETGSDSSTGADDQEGDNR